MIHRRDLFKALPLLAAYPSLAAADPIKAALIPLYLKRNLPAVDVTIDGKGPYKFIFNTGDSAMPTIDVRVAHELKLQDIGGVQVTRGDDKHTATVFAARHVVLGGVADQNRVRMMGVTSGNGGFDGMIPSTFMFDHVTEMDFDLSRIVLFVEGTPDSTGFLPLHYSPLNGGQILIEGEFEGQPARFLIDTGNPDCVTLTPDFVRSHGLWDRYPNWIENIRPVDENVPHTRMVKAGELKLGPIEFSQPIARLMDPKVQYRGHWDGMIGVDLLHHFRLRFDNGPHVVWVRPGAAFNAPYRYDRAGLTFGFSDSRNEAEIVVVAPGGVAANAGLSAGEWLADVNSMEQLQDLTWRLTGAPGDVVPISVKRDGVAKTIPLTLADRL